MPHHPNWKKRLYRERQKQELQLLSLLGCYVVLLLIWLALR